MVNFNDTIPAPSNGGVNVKWQKDTSGNVSAYYLPEDVAASVQTPWLQDIDAAGNDLTGVSELFAVGAGVKDYFAVNIATGGKYWADGYALSIYRDAGGIGFAFGGPGAAGASFGWDKFPLFFANSEVRIGYSSIPKVSIASPVLEAPLVQVKGDYGHYDFVRPDGSPSMSWILDGPNKALLLNRYAAVTGAYLGTPMVISNETGLVTIPSLHATLDAVSKAAIQTPWLQNIDGGGHNLDNVYQIGSAATLINYITSDNFGCGFFGLNIGPGGKYLYPDNAPALGAWADGTIYGGSVIFGLYSPGNAPDSADPNYLGDVLVFGVNQINIGLPAIPLVEVLSPLLVLNPPLDTYVAIDIRQGNQNRFSFDVSEDGSLFSLWRFGDVDSWHEVFIADRSTGQVTFGGDIDMAGWDLFNVQELSMKLNTSITFNLRDISGAWRYVAAGKGLLINDAGAGWLNVYQADSGAAGAAVTGKQILYVSGFESYIYGNHLKLQGDVNQTIYFMAPGAPNDATKFRWNIGPSQDAAANYTITRHDNSGNFLGVPLWIDRLTGVVNIASISVSNASKIALQTPWVTGIDGARFPLSNAGQIEAASYSTGLGSEFAGVTIREANYGNLADTTMAGAPRLQFFWGSWTRASLAFHPGRGLVALDNPGTGYVSFTAKDLIANGNVDITGAYLINGVPIGTGGGGGHTIQDEGSALTARTALNFVGAGVTATDDAANNRTIVTIPGGGSGAQTPWIQNIAGAGYSLSNAGQIHGRVTDHIDALPIWHTSGLVLTEAYDVKATSVDPKYAPRVAFVWTNRGEAQIGWGDGSTVRTFNGAGDGYCDFAARQLVANTTAIAPIALRINQQVDGEGGGIHWNVNNVNRWQFRHGTANDDLYLIAFNNAGSAYGAALTISRASHMGVLFGGSASFYADAGPVSWNAAFDGTNWKYLQTGPAVQAYLSFSDNIWRIRYGASGAAGTNLPVIPDVLQIRPGPALYGLAPVTLTSDLTLLSPGNIMMSAQSAFAQNVYDSTSWKYASNGNLAFHLSTITDRVRFLVAPVGTLGATPAWQEPFSLEPTKVNVNVNLSTAGHTSQKLNAVLSQNMEFTDQWRYLYDGPAFGIGTNSTGTHFYAPASGTVGVPTTLVDVMQITSTSINASVPFTANNLVSIPTFSVRTTAVDGTVLENFQGNDSKSRWMVGYYGPSKAFVVYRCDVTGTAIDSPFAIDWGTGVITLGKPVTAGTVNTGDLTVGGIFTANNNFNLANGVWMWIRSSGNGGIGFNLEYTVSGWRFINAGGGMTVMSDATGTVQMNYWGAGTAGQTGAGVGVLTQLNFTPGSFQFSGRPIETPFQLGITGNIYWDAFNWRYRGGAPGFVLKSDIDACRMMIAPVGSTGAIAPLTEVMLFKPNGVISYPEPIQVKQQYMESVNTDVARPSGAARISGEISTMIFSSLAYDSGMLRLSGGGGTNVSEKAWIDISGYSNLADLNKNITCFIGGNEKLRIDYASIYLTGTLKMKVPTNQQNAIDFQSFANKQRWRMGTHIDPGNNFFLARYDTDGNYRDIPFTVNSDTGLTVISLLTTVINGYVPWSQGGLTRFGLEAGATHFYLWGYDDAGSNPQAAVLVERATGIVTVPKLTSGMVNLGAGVSEKLRFHDGGTQSTSYTSGVESGAIFFQTPGSGWFHFYSGTTPDGGLTSKLSVGPAGIQIRGGILPRDLPSTDPGAGSKLLWYDPADGNRVKYAA